MVFLSVQGMIRVVQHQPCTMLGGLILRYYICCHCALSLIQRGSTSQTIQYMTIQQQVSILVANITNNL